MSGLAIGILAHVDAGKTTLSEAMLYESGSIRRLGRVDKGDAFLDTDAMERERGITIFSKQARFCWKDRGITLLDTPGHVDFSAETERTLQVLDAAVLLIGGAQGVQGHTLTLWRLLERYRVPVFLFVNKMDQEGADRELLLSLLKERFGDGVVDFGGEDEAARLENIAMCDEAVLERYLECGSVDEKTVARLVGERKLFPCLFGSALKDEGVRELLDCLVGYAEAPRYGEAFAARVFKITRDAQGNRLSWMKITGGRLAARDTILEKRAGLEEKVNQIRLYSGEKYESVPEAEAGCVCAVTGLSGTCPGEGLGAETKEWTAVLEPVLTYRVMAPEGTDAVELLGKLQLLEEEVPKMHPVWDELLKEIQIRVMGEVQLEVIQRLIRERFGLEVRFGQGSVVYKETIAAPAVGVGHFEPLRHYAEVHLLLEPGERGSGLVFDTTCSQEMLSGNWQRLVLAHLEEKVHRGVLTGAPITDMRITLIAGRAHLKHTQGGDFRQAACRAVRQGLMEAKSLLLEPFYEFLLQVPVSLIGRAMTDLERMGADMELPDTAGETAFLSGKAPVFAMQNYQKDLAAYSRGLGRLTCAFKGYYPCRDAERVIAAAGYDAESDLKNPPGSVFCAHGAGFLVPWNEVKDYMHLDGDAGLKGTAKEALSSAAVRENAVQDRAETGRERGVIAVEEIDAILDRTYYANRKDGGAGRGPYKRSRGEKEAPAPKEYVFRPSKPLEQYLLVDGYNIIFAWDALRRLAEGNIDGARGRLLDILCDYQAVRGMQLIVVFDAYRVQGHAEETLSYHNIRVVYTREAETADAYIEKFAHANGRKYDVTVATSDGLEQIIIRGQGCRLLSAADLADEVIREKEALREQYLEKKGGPGAKRYLLDGFEWEDNDRS